MSAPQTSQDTAWIQPYYKMDREQLLNDVEPVTLNQIRNTIGDQQFIDQWKLSEADYNNIVEEHANNGTTTVTTVNKTIPSSAVYTSSTTTSAPVRRAYHGNTSGSTVRTATSTGGISTVGLRHIRSSRVGEPLRTSNVRTTNVRTNVVQPVRTNNVRSLAPLTTSVIVPNTRTTAIRSSNVVQGADVPSVRIVGDKQPMTNSLKRNAAPVRSTITAAPLRSSVVVPTNTLGTRVVGTNALRSSYAGHGRVVSSGVRSSVVRSGLHHPARSSYVGVNAPLRSSVIVPTNTLGSRVVGGHPHRTSYHGAGRVIGSGLRSSVVRGNIGTRVVGSGLRSSVVRGNIGTVGTTYGRGTRVLGHNAGYIGSGLRSSS